jgi:hypothetical protein
MAPTKLSNTVLLLLLFEARRKTIRRLKPSIPPCMTIRHLEQKQNMNPLLLWIDGIYYRKNKTQKLLDYLISLWFPSMCHKELGPWTW